MRLAHLQKYIVKYLVCKNNIPKHLPGVYNSDGLYVCPKCVHWEETTERGVKTHGLAGR